MIFGALQICVCTHICTFPCQTFYYKIHKKQWKTTDNDSILLQPSFDLLFEPRIPSLSSGIPLVTPSNALSTINAVILSSELPCKQKTQNKIYFPLSLFLFTTMGQSSQQSLTK